MTIKARMSVEQLPEDKQENKSWNQTEIMLITVAIIMAF